MSINNQFNHIKKLGGQNAFKDNKKRESHQENDNNQPTYWERVIGGKGTVAEDWPTAKELWDNKEVQNDIKEVQNTFNQIKDKSKS